MPQMRYYSSKDGNTRQIAIGIFFSTEIGSKIQSYLVATVIVHYI